jgi:two-component system cell cycle sensor histidine kinase/response regulator CckA
MSAPTVTVLVVEDDDLFREMTVKLLRREGREVLAAADASQALQEARRHGGPIDLLVTDLVMEDGDGLVLARTLARRHPALKVLFMSGYGMQVMRSASLDAPDRTFIEKPFTPATLERAVEELLAGPPPGDR